MMGDEAPKNNHKKEQGGKHSWGSSPHGHSTRSGSTHAVVEAHHMLQVAFDASPEEVKKQFRKLTLSHHPDVPNGSTEKMKAIIGAYEEIKRYWQTRACAL
jgi:DnaJ-class molecular chaperone